MALGKKKGSFTLNDKLVGDAERISGRSAGANSARVMLLDGSVLSLGTVDKKMLGQVAFDQVVRKLDLLERDYFGLLYEDDHKTMQWLDLLKPIKKQLKRQPYTLFFRVRFYAVDPLALHRNSKEQFYLQLKEDISAGRLRFPSESAHSVLSYVLQADVGDYGNSHDDLQYLERKGFLILGKDRMAESSIIKLHKLLQGKTPDQAVEKFLRKTRELDSYGATFNIVEYEGIPYRMGMSPSGITLYQDTSRAAHFKWRKVLQVSYKQKRFTLTLKSRSAEGGERMVTYEAESVKRCKEMWELCVERVSFYNEHQARYMERAERGNDQSRSPSPPTMREYATINDATPQLEAARQQLQQGLQSSPTHGSQQEDHSQQQGDQQAREGGGEGGPRRDVEWGERGERQRGKRKERERSRRDHKTATEGGAVDDKRRRESGEDRASSAHRDSRSPPIDDRVTREGSEEREGDALRRRSRSHSNKMHSLPRRLPTGDPILHHMMQFQHLENHSSRGTLLSDSDSAVETTSPIVSTCDETSEYPEPTGAHPSKYSREQESGFGGGHVRSFSLPQQSTKEEWSHKTQANSQARERYRVEEGDRHHGRRGEAEDHREDRQTEHHETVHDHSVSEEREGEQSVHDSLEELADLLGDEEVPRETDKTLPPRETVTESPVTKPKSKLPNQKPTAEGVDAGVVADKSPPELDREERERRRRQKQLQKQILLQRQQLKEQKLQEYLEKRKQKDSEATPEESRRNSAKKPPPKEDVGPHKEGKKRHRRELQDPLDSQNHVGDGGTRDVVKERKKEERDMVRSWARAHRKAQKEARAFSVSSKAAQLPPQPPSYPDPATEEPLYNRLAPLKPKEDEQGSAEIECRLSTENLPSSPPPPPYQPPSPGHRAAMGIFSGPADAGSSGVKTEPGPHESPTRQRSTGSHNTSTPPTPKSGERSLPNNSPRSAGASVNRPRYTQSFSGGSPMSSAAGSATGSPHTPTRARSLKASQYSPKQPSPSLIPRRRGVEYGSSTGPYPLERGQPLQSVPHGSNESDAMPIPIHLSALQKEDMNISPHNFLNVSSSPPYDKLEKDERVNSVPPIPKKPSTQPGTQYKLETALQEVMASENLPPPPTHLLEVSEHLEDIDYDDLDAPPTAVSGTVLPSRASFEQQQSQEKRDINPDMLAKSLDAPRNSTSNPTSYPPHIAQFMSRVRNSSTDADDPTQTRDPANKPGGTKPPAGGEMSPSDDVFAGLSRKQRPASTKVESRRTSDHQHYDVPKTALGRTISLENASRQSGQPFPGNGPRQRSNTFQVGRGHEPATSHTLPRGHFPTSPDNLGGPRSRETTTSSAHSHSHSDVIPEATWSRDGQLQSSSTHSFQLSSANRTENGVFRQNPRPPSAPIKVTRPATGGGDSIPNSPTYFTQHHPHRDKATPSPETQLENQSFKEHLTSLHPSRGIRSTNVASWMYQSSGYWNSNKSAPFLRESNPPGHPHQRPLNPHLSPAPPPTIATPVPGSHLGQHQQPIRAMQPVRAMQPSATPAIAPSLRLFQSRQFNPLASTSSATSLQRSSLVGLGASQPLPRPHSAKTPTIGDNYYVLDV